ncbi:serine protein kinase RIO [Thermoproteus tenax]|uniref:non-specific serine/threonine protein kinase n=1 Tax=Thermoproteus tenax (strain ATCC 35583 / DSM 2078 / JCM 9277 / NBRC 100435 / Kra 1) TaxID=768679 RepID=G4RP76_THETK|nr:serine protein kinase RIO [Thermoproteus tenax]CCC81371.1 RIO1 family serine/threonine protein kinase [Thermoproteus tenax Kra 1]
MDDIDVKKRVRTEKDHEYFESLDEVFNAYTWRALFALMNRGVVDEVLGSIAQGKEAKVVLARNKKGEEIVLKIYYTTTSTFIKSRYKYILGDPRFKNKKIKKDIIDIVETWCRKEFGNLSAAFKAGVKVPRPIAAEKNILAMEFVGEGGVPAPALYEVGVSGLDDPDEVFWEILRNIERAYIIGKLVHADLSEFNVLYVGGDIRIIDWGSAVKREHPLALEYLARDLGNVFRFFGVRIDGTKAAKVLAERARGEYYEDEEGWLIIGGKRLYELLGQL